MGNKNLIITIEREYGSGGRIVGKKLAEELGISFYDDEILSMTAEKSAVGEKYFRLADEKAGNNLLRKIVGNLRFPAGIFEEPKKEEKLREPQPDKTSTTIVSKEHKNIQNKLKKVEEKISELELKIEEFEASFVKENPSEPVLETYNKTKEELDLTLQEWEYLGSQLEN